MGQGSSTYQHKTESSQLFPPLFPPLSRMFGDVRAHIRVFGLQYRTWHASRFLKAVLSTMTLPSDQRWESIAATNGVWNTLRSWTLIYVNHSFAHTLFTSAFLLQRCHRKSRISPGRDRGLLYRNGSRQGGVLARNLFQKETANYHDHILGAPILHPNLPRGVEPESKVSNLSTGLSLVNPSRRRYYR